MQRMLGIIIVLQGLILVGQWTGGLMPTASAQIPDAGAIRLQQLDEQRKINSKLDQMLALMQSGKMQVVITQNNQK